MKTRVCGVYTIVFKWYFVQGGLIRNTAVNKEGQHMIVMESFCALIQFIAIIGLETRGSEYQEKKQKLKIRAFQMLMRYFPKYSSLPSNEQQTALFLSAHVISGLIFRAINQ